MENNSVFFADPLGLQQQSGGPYHPPDGVKTKCTCLDTCASLSLKINYLKHMIASHVAWDLAHKTNRHANDILERGNNLQICIEFHRQKCRNKQDPPPPVLVPQEQPATRTERVRTATRDVAVGVAAVGTAYVVYRVVRFLPLLFSPLRPTIPLNAAIP